MPPAMMTKVWPRPISNTAAAATPCCTVGLALGLGQTFVIIAGGIDLSVGFVMGFASVVMARSMQTLTLVDAGLALGVGLLAAGSLPSFRAPSAAP